MASDPAKKLAVARPSEGRDDGLEGAANDPRDPCQPRAEGEDTVIACLHEIPEPEQRSGFEYWGVLFACDDLDAAAHRIAAAGGSVEAHVTLPEGAAVSARDPDGAAFFLVHKPDLERPWI